MQARSESSGGWTDAKRVAAARKWHVLGQAFTREATEVMWEALRVRPGVHILDLACGAGVPALDFAARLGPEGHVTATDLGRDILAVAEENARVLGLRNIRFQEAQAQALLFLDASVDAVTCRFGIMFFPDPVQALVECRRVLKPGGRAVFLAWGSAEQPYFASTVGVLKKYAELPALGPAAPHPLRFADAGSLRRAMEQAGLQNVREEMRRITLVWPGPPRQLWEFYTEVAVTYRAALEGLSPEAQRQVAAEVEQALGKYYDGGEIRLPALVVLATGMRG